MTKLGTIWIAPAAIAAATTLGLGGALLLDGAAARIAACSALTVPVLTVAWALIRRRRVA